MRDTVRSQTRERKKCRLLHIIRSCVSATPPRNHRTAARLGFTTTPVRTSCRENQEASLGTWAICLLLALSGGASSSLSCCDALCRPATPAAAVAPLRPLRRCQSLRKTARARRWLPRAPRSQAASRRRPGGLLIAACTLQQTRPSRSRARSETPDLPWG